MISQRQELFELFIVGNKEYFSSIAVDNVIFGYHEKELKILLLKNPNFKSWMLPGGYLKKSEDAETAAVRVAQQRTGLTNLFLQQFKTFCAPGRSLDSQITPEILSRLSGQPVGEDHWMFQPIISIAFYTLTEFSRVVISGGYEGDEHQWWDVNDLPELLFDHRQIIIEAQKALRLHLYHFPIGYELLPDKFTLPEIHNLYETIMGKQMDDRNFTRKLMSLGIVTKTNEIKKAKGHRSPNLYKFETEIYKKALEEGIFIT